MSDLGINADKLLRALQKGFLEAMNEADEKEATKPSGTGIPDTIKDFMGENKNPFATVTELDMALRSIIATREGKAAGRVLDFIIEHHDHFLSGQKAEEEATTGAPKVGHYFEDDFTYTGDKSGWVATWKGQGVSGAHYTIRRGAAHRSDARRFLIEAIEAEGFVKA